MKAVLVAAAVFAVIVTALAVFFSLYIRNLKKKSAAEAERIRKEGAEHAKRTADIITEAEKVKQDADTGCHSDGLRAMAGWMHEHAHGGK